MSDMSEFETTWSKEDLKIYLMIFCANADFQESTPELTFIKSQVHTSDFDKIHKELEKDNDYASLQKIQHAIKRLNCTQEEIDNLRLYMKELFMSDQKFDILERNLDRALDHLLQ